MVEKRDFPTKTEVEMLKRQYDEMTAFAKNQANRIDSAMADLAFVLIGPVSETDVPVLERAYNTLKDDQSLEWI